MISVSLHLMTCLFLGNVTQPRVLLNSTTGVSILSLTNVNISKAGVYMCSSKNSISNDLEVQVRRESTVSYLPLL